MELNAVLIIGCLDINKNWICTQPVSHFEVKIWSTVFLIIEAIWWKVCLECGADFILYHAKD